MEDIIPPITPTLYLIKKREENASLSPKIKNALQLLNAFFLFFYAISRWRAIHNYIRIIIFVLLNLSGGVSVPIFNSLIKVGHKYLQ